VDDCDETVTSFKWSTY